MSKRFNWNVWGKYYHNPTYISYSWYYLLMQLDTSVSYRSGFSQVQRYKVNSFLAAIFITSTRIIFDNKLL